MIDASALSKAFGARSLFSDVSLRIDKGDRLALVGRNGSGKTTLLKILAGEENPDNGDVRGRRDSAVGYLPQEIALESEEHLIIFVENVAGELKSIQLELEVIHERLAAGEEDAALVAQSGNLQSRFEALGGYRLRSRAQQILSGLGFVEEDFAKPLSNFSGGWRMRALLARILLTEPDVILLDEPTNHLDIVTLEWLENFINSSRAGFLIVSHDVSFLDRVVNGVFALELGGAVRSKGNYTKYVSEREERLRLRQAEYERRQRKRAEEERFIERFRAKNTKAKQVQSRIKKLERDEPIVAPMEDSFTAPAIRFPQPERSGKDVVKVKGVEAGYGDLTVFSSLDFTLHRGEKVAFIGPNGAGKSTLLKTMAGEVSPRAGEVRYGHNVSIGYFSQHQMELLNPKRTVLEEVLALPGYRSEGEARSILGGFLFTGDDVEKRVSVLSGGEKSRLVMALLLTQPGNLLLLDEPTNHLDIDACETLKKALLAYEGTVAVITHDRDLINRVATRVVYVEDGVSTEYIGNYDDYLRAKARLEAGEEELEAAQKRVHKGKEARREAAKAREEFAKRTKELRKKVEKYEGDLATREDRKAEIESLLADPDIYSDPVKGRELGRERQCIMDELEIVTSMWEEAALELEELELSFKEEMARG
ncbi:MAG: ABC transporter ATP-binding protein [Deltaproteobacteria bacterium]|nr:MAG: ABC transporter ATP-binding protein [Deltaproteobacteria bacterium]